MIKIGKMEMKNFKSFRRANIPFSKGFTTIAGPNGAGKSNILDALLFVLGVTSLKTMRAQKLTDLVNHAADDGTARVDLYLENGDQTYKITRHVDRSGKSVYRLNEKRCALNEVANLLSEVGITPTGHNIVAQGDITRIIQMNAKERRAIIDEASGISEFNEKKDEALKELDKANARIKEARIVLNEREQFLNDLAAEREAAKKYQQLTEELKQTKATVLRLEITHIDESMAKNEAREKGLAERLAERTKKREETATQIAAVEGEIEEANTYLISANERLFDQTGREIERQKSAIGLCDQKNETLLREKEREETRAKKAGEETEEATKAEKEARAREKELAQKRAELENAQKAHAEARVREKHREALHDHGHKKATAQELSRAILELEGAKANCPLCDTSLEGGVRERVLEKKRKEHEKHAKRAEELEKRISELESEQAAHEAREKELSRVRQEHFEAQTRAEQMASRKKELDAHAHEARKRLAEIEEALLATQKEKEAAQKELKRLEVDYIRANEQNKHVVAKKEKGREKLNALLERREKENIAIRDTEQQINALQIDQSKLEVRKKDLEEEYADFTEVKTVEGHLAHLRERVPRIEREIAGLGAVNMKALDSFEGLQKEVDELRAKANKLEEEKISVLNMIQSIEDRRLEVFKNCFDSVNAHFNKIFYSFFEGEGHLGLTDPENPLESGLLIEAKHKSDKLTNIDLMSGGEKTLTALAFLFSIQLYEPSPFYVFDEADAALDKANSIKMAEMIKDISRKSQFIAITHNDTIIKNADQLVGVTLNQQKSSVIGIKLKGALREALEGQKAA